MGAAPDADVIRPRRVVPWLVVGVLSFSSSAILVRYAGEAPGLAVAVWRTGLAVLFLAPFVWKKVGREIRRFSPKEGLMVVASGVFLGLHFVTWIESIYHTSIASATVILSTTPLFLGVLGFLFLRERLSPRLLTAIFCGIAGTALIAWGDAADQATGTFFGNGLALTAALAQCFYLLIGRVVRRRTSWMAYVFPLYAVAAVTTLVVALMEGVPLLGYDPLVYGLCALMALGPQILGHGSFNYAVKYIAPAVLGLLGLSEPVIASILAAVLFSEVPDGLALTGMFIVLLSVAVVLLQRRRGGAAPVLPEVLPP